MKQRSRLRNIVEEVKIGKLFMIDLAGSERAANTQVNSLAHSLSRGRILCSRSYTRPYVENF